MPTTSPNMGMPIPSVGIDSGPGWATNLDASLSIVDNHDHSSGKGTPVITAGININADLAFNGFNALSLKSSRFTAQGSPLSTPSDIGCIYVSGVDLYYNDVNGNQIRMTASGAISSSPGNISGLVPPASAAYNAGTGTFIFQRNTNVPATMDMGSIIIREEVVSPFGVTIASPTGLVADYTLTLPGSLPVSGSNALYVDTSGNLTFVNSGTIVGTGGSYATITAAIAAVSAGALISVLPGTYTENLTISKRLKIVALGAATLNGTLTFATSSDKSVWDGFDHGTNTITVNSGVSSVSITDVYVTSRTQITDNGTATYVAGFEG